MESELAQQGGGTISGSVTNSQGAAISGSAVEVKSVATNAVFSAVTNTSGFYTAPSLAVGEYEVAAQFEGFKRAVRSGITLQVNQTARIDIVLEIGEVVETIEVVGEAPLVQSDTSTLGEVIERRRMVELPINGRGALAGSDAADGGRGLERRTVELRFRGPRHPDLVAIDQRQSELDERPDAGRQ